MEEHGLNERQLIGSRIREARVGRRMSQADLAAKANISLPHPDVPEVRSLYQSEFDELLADCSPKELDSILKIVREVKSTMTRREDND